MTDASPDPASDGQPTAEQAAVADAALADAAAASASASPAFAPAADPHPERAVGAAFAGGLVLALFLKRLAR